MKNQIITIIMIVASLFIAQSCATTLFSTMMVNGSVLRSSICGESDSWMGRTGAQAGVILPLMQFNELMSLNAGLNGSLQGAKWEEDWGEGLTKGKTNLFYVNLPVVVRYQLENGFYGEAGLQPGILLSAKDKYNDVTYDYKEYIKTFDLSIPLGVGYEFKNNFGVGLRVIPGLTNVNAGDYESHKDRNFVMALRATYTFKLK